MMNDWSDREIGPGDRLGLVDWLLGVLVGVGSIAGIASIFF
jgi:hypothetical protein